MVWISLVTCGRIQTKASKEKHAIELGMFEAYRIIEKKDCKVTAFADECSAKHVKWAEFE